MYRGRDVAEKWGREEERVGHRKGGRRCSKGKRA